MPKQIEHMHVAEPAPNEPAHDNMYQYSPEGQMFRVAEHAPKPLHQVRT